MSGNKNSSKTRVWPAFSKLSSSGERMRWFFGWVNENQATDKRISLKGVDWDRIIVVFAGEDGKGEIGLAPSPSLLKWLVLNAGKEVKMPAGHEKAVSKATYEKRKMLFDGGSHEREHLQMSAIREINRGGRRGWFILEGYSKPDVYIETNKFIFVVEGKRTEIKPTDRTSFLPASRDQLARHMDCALEISVGRPVYGMTIYEEGSEKEFGGKEFDAGSIKHRSVADKQRLSDGYLKPATWQSLQKYCQKHLKLDLGYVEELA